MPTSGFDLYHMQDAKNNFNAMRPAPICTETNQFMGQCQNIHVSTNCYYGYHGAKWTTNSQQQNEVDCEMHEIPSPNLSTNKLATQNNARKRSADDAEFPRNKRLKEDVSSTCNLVGTRSSPIHSASAFNTKQGVFYLAFVILTKIRYIFV